MAPIPLWFMHNLTSGNSVRGSSHSAELPNSVTSLARGHFSQQHAHGADSSTMHSCSIWVVQMGSCGFRTPSGLFGSWLAERRIARAWLIGCKMQQWNLQENSKDSFAKTLRLSKILQTSLSIFELIAAFKVFAFLQNLCTAKLRVTEPHWALGKLSLLRGQTRTTAADRRAFVLRGKVALFHSGDAIAHWAHLGPSGPTAIRLWLDFDYFDCFILFHLFPFHVLQIAYLGQCCFFCPWLAPFRISGFDAFSTPIVPCTALPATLAFGHLLR